MSIMINTSSYTKLSKVNGTIENRIGLKIGLRSGAEMPNNDAIPELIVENEERIAFQADKDEFVYAIVLNGENDREYEIDIATFFLSSSFS